MTDLSFKECYRLLSIDCDNSWAQVRKAYKSIIQKSHPDRFTDNSVEKSNAEEKIKKLNAAYKRLDTYYKTYSKLPDTSIINDEIIKPTRTRKKAWEKTKSNTSDKKNRSDSEGSNRPNDYTFKHNNHYTSHSKKIFKIFAVIILVFPLIFTFFYFINKSTLENSSGTYSPKTTSLSQPNLDQRIAKPNTTKPKVEALSNKDYFTIGSSIGKVILVQGEPSKIIGNSWHYGKSIVYFDKGLVTEWKRHPNHPLKALLAGKKSNNNKRIYSWQKK